jgi:hypothetical protein
MNKISKKLKIKTYEKFLHKLHVALTCKRHDLVRELVLNADRWSRAHRAPLDFTEQQRQQSILEAFLQLTTTTNHDNQHN